MSGVERRKHWWNGKWGRLARRDVLLYEDAGTWWVEARGGGHGGPLIRRQYGDEDRAMDCVHGLIAGTDRWREVGGVRNDPPL